MKYPEHKHPHGPENVHPNPYRVWVCEECFHVFSDDELRIDLANGVTYHICKSHPYKKGQRCESHLEPYTPDRPTTKESK